MHRASCIHQSAWLTTGLQCGGDRLESGPLPVVMKLANVLCEGQGAAGSIWHPSGTRQLSSSQMWRRRSPLLPLMQKAHLRERNRDQKHPNLQLGNRTTARMRGRLQILWRPGCQGRRDAKRGGALRPQLPEPGPGQRPSGRVRPLAAGGEGKCRAPTGKPSPAACLARARRRGAFGARSWDPRAP